MKIELSQKIKSLLLVGLEIIKIVAFAMFFLCAGMMGLTFWGWRFSEDTFIFIGGIGLGGMLLQEMNMSRPENDPIYFKFESYMSTLLRWWGMLFRTLTISLVGFAGYALFDSQPIGDTPFSELTLNLVVSYLLKWLIVIGCIVWFFNFPNRKTKEPDDSPYVIWGLCPILMFCIICLGLFISGPLFGPLFGFYK